MPDEATLKSLVLYSCVCHPVGTSQCLDGGMSVTSRRQFSLRIMDALRSLITMPELYYAGLQSDSRRFVRLVHRTCCAHVTIGGILPRGHVSLVSLVHEKGWRCIVCPRNDIINYILQELAFRSAVIYGGLLISNAFGNVWGARCMLTTTLTFLDLAHGCWYTFGHAG